MEKVNLHAKHLNSKVAPKIMFLAISCFGDTLHTCHTELLHFILIRELLAYPRSRHTPCCAQGPLSDFITFIKYYLY